uniref:Testis expressed 11 n=1 Tax=Callorhinchus milii TaxID=7868 RepID=A0A4W3HZV5_CALMI
TTNRDYFLINSMAFNRDALSFDFLTTLSKQFETSHDIGKILLIHLLQLLQSGQKLAAKHKLEDIIEGRKCVGISQCGNNLVNWSPAQNYAEALQWYNYSLSFYPAGQMDQNLAKLQRNRASCYLHLKQLGKAKESVKEAERCDSDSIFTQFSVYKIAILENDIEKGRSWNSALQCEDCPSRMREFFMLSYQLSQMHPVDKGVLIGQKTCLLMAAAASLEMGRKAPNTSEQIERLTQAQEHIEVCWEVWRTLKSTAAGDISKDPTETLLLLYEFEARAKLNDSDIDHVLERVLQLQQIEPKTLETLASLSMEAPAHYPSVCRKALKIALSLQKKQPDVDVARCSKCLHSLIQLSLPTGVSDIESQILEEVWSYCEEALIIIDSTEEYPEVEILWLMTRAWNTGVSLYSLGKYSEAERWCGLGMRFLKYLGSLKNSYEAQVRNVSQRS